MISLPIFTPTADSLSPNEQRKVQGTPLTPSQTRCCIRKQPAQERLSVDIMAQKAFCRRFPWWASCQPSTARRVNGSPVAASKARWYSQKIAEAASALTNLLLELATFVKPPAGWFKFIPAAAGGRDAVGATCLNATRSCGAASLNSTGIRVAFMGAD